MLLCIEAHIIDRGYVLAPSSRPSSKSATVCTRGGNGKHVSNVSACHPYLASACASPRRAVIRSRFRCRRRRLHMQRPGYLLR